MPADRSLPWSRIELPRVNIHGHEVVAAYECQIGLANSLGIAPVTVFLIVSYMGNDFEFSAVVNVAGEVGMGLVLAFSEVKNALESRAADKIDRLFYFGE